MAASAAANPLQKLDEMFKNVKTLCPLFGLDIRPRGGASDSVEFLQSLVKLKNGDDSKVVQAVNAYVTKHGINKDSEFLYIGIDLDLQNQRLIVNKAKFLAKKFEPFNTVNDFLNYQGDISAFAPEEVSKLEELCGDFLAANGQSRENIFLLQQLVSVAYSIQVLMRTNTSMKYEINNWDGQDDTLYDAVLGLLGESKAEPAQRKKRRQKAHKN